MSLSDRAVQGRLVLIDHYDLTEPKTKLLQQALDRWPSRGQSTLIVTKKEDVNIIKAAHNLPKVSTIYYGSLNLLDVLAYQYLILDQSLLPKIKEQYLA